jgi:dTDP-4-amino-4,6-dideoxygalactose transaminase
MGAKHCEFEKMLKTYLGVSNVALFTNGHSALECAFEALDLRGKVITTPFTFASTIHAIVRKGLEPVFADVRSDNYTIDTKSIERLIDSNTCAIVPVHVYGNLCDTDAIQEIAERHSLKVIYDAAHAFGLERDDVSAAAFGDVSMFSFHATKVFNTIEGGALCFKDPKLKPRLDQWKNFGITSPEDVEYAGGNAKMNEFCAAMGICNLRHLDEEIAKRKTVAEHYWSNLCDIEGLKLIEPTKNIKQNYAYVPVVFEESFGATRDDVFEALAKEGISTRQYFYPLASDYACYQERFDSAETPVARDVASRVLTLPMYAGLEMETVNSICTIVRGCGQ